MASSSFTAKPRWKSFQQLKYNLEELRVKIERQAKRELIRKAAAPMLKKARQNAPVDKVINGGDLRKSLVVKVSTTRDKSAVVATIGPNRAARGLTHKGRESWPVKYAHLVEFGTAHMSAQPYMRPTFDSTKDESLRIYKEGLKDAIERVAKRFAKKYQTP